MNRTLAQLVSAADRRGIKSRFLAEFATDEFLELSDGRKTLIVNKTKTPYLSAVQAKLVTDKFLSGRLMADAGLPVAPKRLSLGLSAEDVRFLEENREIIVKPNRADRGVGVTERVRSVDGLEAGFEKARGFGPVLLEKYLVGREYRVLVINGRAVATLERKPLVVTGDGIASVRALIERLNADPRRGPASGNYPLRPIVVDQHFAERLRRSGVGLEDVPGAGETVQLSFANHLDSGGVACDRTDEAHPSYLDLAVRAARLFAIDVAGIDLICPDITLPFSDGDEAAVLEVNPGPDICWHIFPAEGEVAAGGG